MTWLRLLLVTFVLALGLLGSGCSKEGCLAGGANCRVESPCPKLTFSCPGAGPLTARIIQSVAERPGGWNALGTVGDVRLSNGVVEAVIAGLGNQNYLDPNGGSLLDLANVGHGNDGLNQLLQVTGILPGDAVHYTSLEVIEESDRVGVQLKGRLDGDDRVKVYTLYELRPCDVGVRMRTEIVNGSTDQKLFFTSDGFYWSGREALPFTPAPGAGFTHPSFNLLTINDAFETFPFLAASTHVAPHASYAHVSCTQRELQGFQSDQVSASGLPRAIVPPREFQVFERFLAVIPDDDVAGAANVAMDVRAQLFGERHVVMEGTVGRAGAASFDNEREATVLISEGALATAPEKRTPWTQVVPDASGRFRARVPANKTYVVEVRAFGVKAGERELAVGAADVDAGNFLLPSAARVTFSVRSAQNLDPIDAEIFLVPADDATREAVRGDFYGRFGSCAPWLGAPPGASAACNRVLVRGGAAIADVPVGEYWAFAFHGPFWSLERQRVSLTAASATLSFQLTPLPLRPTGTVTADLHVHGAASFDSQIPDETRVLSFAASDLEVIVATDHEVVYDYTPVIERLGLQARMNAVTGVETTGHIPFLRIPGYGFPLVIGHYNFWPLRYDPSQPRNGAPFDELIEPGELFDRTAPLFSGTPVIELNHPYAEPEFGRDLGFPRAIALDATQDLPSGDDGTNNGVFVRAPAGGATNDGHHAQEVINGSDATGLLPYRAFWWFMLNQGRLKTGTANSDSHGLTDNTVGIPRNVVYADTSAGAGFDVNVFNQAIRDGRVLGTNGPVIEATLEDAQGARRGFGLSPFSPHRSGVLRVKVSAAPWVPVDEVRVVVNGAVVRAVTDGIAKPPDPYGAAGLVRYEADLPLAELLQGIRGDAWLSVEAGRALPLAGDLAGRLDGLPDGIPDTSDNNGDGVVDAADVEAGAKSGPLHHPPAPTDPNDPLYGFSQITGGALPFAFTNPFVLDLDGNGRFDAPGVGGGR